jgi:hypothetical protein
MSPSLQRGKWFVALATIVVVEQIWHFGTALSSDLEGLKWFKAMLRPIANIVVIFFLWKGHEWLRWLIGILYVLTGAPLAYVSARVLVHFSNARPPESSSFLNQLVGLPISLIFLVGVLYILIGLPFLISPSMIAFLRSREEIRQMGTPSD